MSKHSQQHRRHQHLRSLLLAGAALTLVVSACSVSKSSTDDKASNKTTTSAPAGVDYAKKFANAPVQGITKDTIKLGFAVIDYKKVKDQFGVDLGNGGDPLPDGTLEALVKSVNDAGGINGRKIEIVTEPFIPVGTESSEASCRKLIEDEKVFAVVGMYLGDNGLCVTETHQTPYFSGWGLNDQRQARSKAPFITVQYSDEEVAENAMQKLIDEGTLKGKKVAVYWDSETSDNAIEKNVVGTLKKAGIDVVSKAKLPQTGDQVKAGQDIDTIMQRFKADGADTVIFYSGLAVVVPALERSAWKPEAIFTNGQANGDLSGFGLKNPKLLDGDIAVMGSIPTSIMEKDPTFLACLKTINDNSDLNLKPTDVESPKERPGSVGANFIPQLCQIFNMTVEVLDAAGPNPSASSIITGMAKLSSFKLAAIPDASLGPDDWSAGMNAYLWAWNPDTARFVRSDEPGAK